jgi:hypothetical protein
MDHDLDPDIPPILEEVLKISPRWCSLRLNDPMPASFFRRLAENGLDTLVEADLTKGLAGCNFDSTTISFFAPRLRTLSISSDWLVPMPWAQLTYLYLTGRRSLDISLGVLAQCTNLVTVSINTSGWRTVPQPGDMILLNHLRTLFLSFTRTPAQDHFMPLLDRISAPSLERLRLYSHPNYTWIKAQFTVFQLRSPNITEIELNHSPLTPADLRAVLFHAPSLTHLSVIFCPQCIDDTLLRALTYADGVESLVPRLRHLTLFVINPLSEDVLTSMILSRWWTEVDLSSRSAPPSVARWTDINLTVNHRFFKFSRDFMDIMDGLKGDGLRIQVDT